MFIQESPYVFIGGFFIISHEWFNQIIKLLPTFQRHNQIHIICMDLEFNGGATKKGDHAVARSPFFVLGIRVSSVHKSEEGVPVFVCFSQSP